MRKDRERRAHGFDACSSEDTRQLWRGVVYIDSVGVTGDRPAECACEASEADVGRECWNDQRCGSGSPSVDVVAREYSLGSSLMWLTVVTGENADAVVGVCVGAGFSGRR